MEPDEAYSYDGYLVFNEILTFEEPVDIDAVINQLPIFEQVIQEETSPVGVTARRLSDFDPPLDLDENDVEYQITDHIHEVEIKDIGFEEVVSLDKEGNSKEVTLRTVDTISSYWVEPNFVLIRADRQEAHKAKRFLEDWIGNTHTLNSTDFHPDFLLWLFYHEFTNMEGFNGLSIEHLTDAKVTGSNMDHFGKMNRASDSTDITLSTPILMSILRDSKDLTMIGGMFRYNNNLIPADISANGRVHIKANSGDIKDSSDFRRVLLSIDFLRKLAAIYEGWESLSPEEKYPPPDFFRNVNNTISKQGAEVAIPIEPVIDKYQEKRAQQ